MITRKEIKDIKYPLYVPKMSFYERWIPRLKFAPIKCNIYGSYTPMYISDSNFRTKSRFLDER
jgi:hypothetical protein